jgi:ABC-type spermidine/putrescine transport system permease subunit I
VPLFSSLFVIKKYGLLFTDGWFGGLTQGEQYHSTLQISVIVFIIISLLAYLLCLYIIFKNTMKTVVIYLIIISGLISQLIMSFSPTVYASGIRTATLLFITLSITGTAVFSHYAEQNQTGKTGFLIFVVSIVFIAFLTANLVIGLG